MTRKNNKISEKTLKIKKRKVSERNNRGYLPDSPCDPPFWMKGEISFESSGSTVSLSEMIKKKEIAQINLSCSCKEVILGTLLGDGSLKIQRGYKNPRLTIRHSILQKEYFE